VYLKVVQYVDSACLFSVGMLHMTILLTHEAHLVTEAA